jgi:hypothetical protein
MKKAAASPLLRLILSVCFFMVLQVFSAKGQTFLPSDQSLEKLKVEMKNTEAQLRALTPSYTPDYINGKIKLYYYDKVYSDIVDGVDVAIAVNNQFSLMSKIKPSYHVDGQEGTTPYPIDAALKANLTQLLTQ